MMQKTFENFAFHFISFYLCECALRCVLTTDGGIPTTPKRTNNMHGEHDWAAFMNIFFFVFICLPFSVINYPRASFVPAWNLFFVRISCAMRSYLLAAGDELVFFLCISFASSSFSQLLDLCVCRCVWARVWFIKNFLIFSIYKHKNTFLIGFIQSSSSSVCAISAPNASIPKTMGCEQRYRYVVMYKWKPVHLLRAMSFACEVERIVEWWAGDGLVASGWKMSVCYLLFAPTAKFILYFIYSELWNLLFA